MNFKFLFLAFALFFAGTLSAQQDAISAHFSKYVNDEDFTVVYVSGKMFNLMETVISNLDTDDMNSDQVKALTDVVQDMKSLRILNRDGDGIELYKEAKRTIANAKPYEVLMTVREKGSTFVDFYVRENDGVVDELLLLVGESADGRAAALLDGEDEVDFSEGNFTLLSFEGHIDLNKIGALAKAFEDDDGKVNISID
ncbi:MAG: DUF4252 domain-containing protein [Saprospiraceae bacterium]